THQDQVQGTHCHHQSARLRRQLRAKDRDARWPENSRPNQSPLAKLGLIPVRWTIRPLLELDLTTRRRNRAESCCPPAIIVRYGQETKELTIEAGVPRQAAAMLRGWSGQLRRKCAGARGRQPNKLVLFL